MWNPTDSLPMTVEQKQTWEGWIRAKTTPRRIVLGSRICLLAAEGKANHAIAHHLDTSRPTALLWRKRFAAAGPSGLPEAAQHGPSGPPPCAPESQGHRGGHAADDAARRDPLEHADDGKRAIETWDVWRRPLVWSISNGCDVAL